MAQVDLISKTGITGSNYKYWASKAACDEWFKGKSIATVEAMAFIRPDQTTRSGYNAAAVHVPLDYKTCVECDYISFSNEAEGGRMYHAQVISREYVNEKSTRLYFAVDYVATFWDTIKLNKSFVERTHVGDDWSGGFTASKYLLPEPVPVNIFYRPTALNANPFDDTNTELVLSAAQYNMVTSVDINGTINAPKINFQTGGAVTGNIYSSADPADIEQYMAKYVTYTSKVINRTDSVTQYLNNLYVCPETVVFQQQAPIMTTVTASWNSVFNLGAMYKPRHAKVYDYLRIRIYTAGGGAGFAPQDLPDGLLASILKTGGPSGCYTATLRTGVGGEFLQRISTPTWPAISYSASIRQNEYQFNERVADTIGAMWAEKEARKAEYNRRHPE